MGNENISLSYSALFFGQTFWQKVLQTPVGSKASGYWLAKLKRKMEAAHRKTYPKLVAFAAELAEQAGERNEDGTVKSYVGQAMPNANPAKRALYEEMFFHFCEQKVEVELPRLSLELFDHLQFTPTEWEALTQVANVDPAAFNAPTAGPQLVSG